MPVSDRRRFLAGSTCATLLAAMTMGGHAAAAELPRIVSLTLGRASGAGESAQFGIGVSEGLYAQQGLDLKSRYFDSNAAMGPALIAGSLDIITDGDVPAIPLLATGAPVRVLCPISDFSSDQAIVVDSSITNPHDLLDKKIGLFKGAVCSLLIERYAAHYHLDLRRLHLINMTAAQQVAALATKQIDGYVSWEPWVWDGVHKIAGAHVLARGNAPYSFIKVFELLIAREDYLKSHTEAVKRLLRGTIEATNVLNSAEPLELQKMAGYIRQIMHLQLPIEALVSMVKRRHYTMAIDQSFLASEEHNTVFLAKAGKIAHVVPFGKWLDRKPLLSVAPDLVKV